MNYMVKRIKVCSLGFMWFDMIYPDINEAYRARELFSNCCCTTNCGCQFQVEEGEALQFNYYYKPYNYQPFSYIDIYKPFYTNYDITNTVPYTTTIPYYTSTNTNTASYIPYISTNTANYTSTII